MTMACDLPVDIVEEGRPQLMGDLPVDTVQEGRPQ